MAASTGAAGKELEGLRDVVEDVYAANYGDSVADVGDAVAMVNRNMANLDQNGLTAATEGALALRDAFEYDVAESTRAAEAIRKNFGSSAEEAFSLIAAGAQNGLDYSGELIDTINEYSSQFAKLGFDADGMFNILQAGADGTAWNLDKVGDAIKEFSIRAIDGSDSTVEAFTSLGYNAENIMATFAAGGEGANKAFFDVINTLMAVDDQVERDALGVALFGTMWEDLGTEAMEAMAGASQAAYDTEGALEKINQVKYNDLDSAIQGIGRQMEVALLPAADAVYQSLMDSMPEITEAMEEVSPVIAEIAGDFADWAGGAISDGLPVLVDGIRDFANWAGKAYEKAKPFLSFLWEHKGTVLAVAAALRVLGPAIGAVTTAMNAFKTAKTFMALLQSSGKIAQVTAACQRFGSILTGPLGIIIAVAGAIALLYKNWDTVKAWLVNFGNTVNQIWTNFSNMVGNAIAAIGQKFPMLGAYLQGWWESIQAAVDNVKAIFQNIIDFISNVFSGNWSAAWQNIVNIFGNLFGMIVNLAKAPINGVISAINWVISKINSISVTIPDWVPGVGGKTLGFNIPTIPQ
ncbi:MAG: phage tail tape measure protein, partial [Evtepia gabavorous]